MVGDQLSRCQSRQFVQFRWFSNRNRAIAQHGKCLFKYGFRLKKISLKIFIVLLLYWPADPINNAQYLPYPMPYYPLVKPRTMRNYLGIDLVMYLMPFPINIDTLINGPDKKILISTSDFSKILQTPAKYCS